jgi:hypothetical protein
MATARTRELQELAERIAGALPPAVEEVVITGSVSRGVADDVSDIEMLLVTSQPLELEECFEHARAAGLERLDTWGPQGTDTKRVFGYREGVPIELVWWSRDFADASVDGILAGGPSASAEALANGVAIRSAGLLEGWQERLRDYPDALAAFHAGDSGGLRTWLLYSCEALGRGVAGSPLSAPVEAPPPE